MLKRTLYKGEWKSHRIKPSYKRVLDTSGASTVLVAFKNGTVKEVPWTPDGGFGTYYEPDGDVNTDGKISNNGKNIIAWTYLPAPPEVYKHA